MDIEKERTQMMTFEFAHLEAPFTTMDDVELELGRLESEITALELEDSHTPACVCTPEETAKVKKWADCIARCGVSLSDKTCRAKVLWDRSICLARMLREVRYQLEDWWLYPVVDGEMEEDNLWLLSSYAEDLDERLRNVQNGANGRFHRLFNSDCDILLLTSPAVTPST